MLIVLAVVILLLIAALYFLYFYKVNCSSRECFDEELAECNSAGFIEDSATAAWQYDIEGKGIMCLFSKNYCENCKVDVKLLQIKEGSVDSAKLEGLDMVCTLPFELVVNPQDDLSKCHGPLKEQMQELMINRLHAYVLSHVGEIGVELNKIV